MIKKVFIALVSDRDGGLEESLVFYTNLLTSQGLEVHVLTPKNAPYLKRISNLVQYITFQPRGYYDAVAFYKLILTINRFKPDLVIGFNSRASYYLGLCSKFFTCTQSIGYSHSYKHKKMIYVDKLICITTDMKSYFLEKGFDHKKVFVLPPIGVNTISLGKKIQKRTGLLKIGFLGRMDSEKGLLRLISSIKKAKEKDNITLFIAGDGEERTRALEMARDYNISVVFQGWIDEKTEFFDKIDLLAVPSDNETFGIALLEALSYGVPVISTPSKGPTEILLGQKCGWLTKDFSPESLANLIDAVYSKDLSLFSDECRKRSLDFSITAIKEDLIEIIES